MPKQTELQLEKQVAKLEDDLEAIQQTLAEMSDDVSIWQPKRGDFLIEESGLVSLYCPKYQEYDYFVKSRKSRVVAEEASSSMQTFNKLLAYRDEFDSGFKADFDNDPAVYSVFFCHNENSWSAVEDKSRLESPTSVFMSGPVAYALTVKLNSGEVVL